LSPVNSQNITTVGDMMGLMEDFAPLSLAEAWDNCGLQVGDAAWPVRSVWIALDPLLGVVEAAKRQQVDLVITHHPLLIEPIQRIDVQTQVGKIIAASLEGQLAIYSAHTNLDSTWGGVNDIFAHRIGLTNLTALVSAPANFEPPTTVQGEPLFGIGRVGELVKVRSVAQLAAHIKERLGLPGLRVVGDANRPVQRAAICSGSGGGLMGAFLASGADVYISGDIKYHQARVVEDAGRAVIDVGHFASEHLITGPLAMHLEKAVKSAGWNVSVEGCRLERDPFAFV